MDPERCGEVFELVLGELERLAAQGFNASAIEAAVNSVEFTLR